MSDENYLSDETLDELLRLHYNAPPTAQPVPRRGPALRAESARSQTGRHALRAAAVVLVFLGGWVLGQRSSPVRETPQPGGARATNDGAFLLSEVQRAGSAYLGALAAAAAVQNDSVFGRLIEQVSAQTLVAASQQLMNRPTARPEAIKVFLASSSLRRASAGAAQPTIAVEF